MMKLTRTGIGLLTAQYRSVLKKCFLINAGLFLALAPNVASAVDCSTLSPSSSAADIAACVGTFSLQNQPTPWTYTIAGWDSSWKANSRRNNINPTNISASNIWTFENYKGHYTISTSASILQNLEALDAIIGGFSVITDSRRNNYNYINKLKSEGTTGSFSLNPGYETISTQLMYVDWVVGALQSGNHISNMASMGDNIKTLDTAIGTKQTGTYITGSDVYSNLKALDTQVAANTSTIAAHTAVINALDNNYYRNIKFSRAEKLKKSPLAERSECIQGSTDFFKKFEDALTTRTAWRHDSLIAANDNHVTTGNTTMYKKEA